MTTIKVNAKGKIGRELRTAPQKVEKRRKLYNVACQGRQRSWGIEKEKFRTTHKTTTNMQRTPFFLRHIMLQNSGSTFTLL